MGSKRYVLIIGFILLTHSIFGQEEGNGLSALELGDKTYKELSQAEWKRFKQFEKKLEFTKPDQERQLRAYARDSIQILEVKLMAVKLLREKNLLEKDISENSAYYITLLEELRKSGIPQLEYQFLEEKLAFLNQAALEKKLSQSRWLNLGLLLLSFSLFFFVFRFRKKTTLPPELSKQETTVRNLILQGKTNKEIANELFISLSTVKTHITNIYGKLNVSNRQELFQKGTGTST